MPSGPPRKRETTPPGRHPRRALAVRVILTRLAWLDAPLAWSGDRPVWRTSEGDVAPDAALLARTQRALHKLRTYPYAAAEVLGDPDAWMGERAGRLEQAKRLAAIREPEVEALLRRARSGDAAALDKALVLLEVEALARNPLPASPAAALAAAPGARSALIALAQSEAQPEVTALAALALGARREAGQSPKLSAFARRAYAFGAAHGVPEHPSFVVRLLCEADREALAGRLAAAREALSADPEDAAWLTDLLARAEEPDRAVDAAEALVKAAEPLALVRFKPLERTAAGQALDVAARESRRRLWAALKALAAGPGAAATTSAASLIPLFLALPAPVNAAADEAAAIMGVAAALPAAEAGAFLTILTRRFEVFWPAEACRACKRARFEARNHAGWFYDQRWRTRPLPAAIGQFGAANAERAAVLGLRKHEGWTSPQHLELILDILEQTSIDPKRVRRIENVFGAFPSPAEARRVFNRLVTACGEASDLFYTVVETVEHEDRIPEMLDTILPALHLIAAADGDPEDARSYLIALATARRLQPACDEAWLRWLIDYAQRQDDEWGWYAMRAFETRVGIAALVCKGRLDRFQRLVEGSAACEYPRSVDLRKLFDQIAGSEALRTVLAESFTERTARCERLLTRLSWGVRVDPQLVKQLDDILPTIDDAAAIVAEPAWTPVLDNDCDPLETAAEYAAARRVLGLDLSVPPAVGRAVGLLEKLAREARHLAAREAAGALDAHAVLRLRNLEARLADRAGLERSVIEELDPALRGAVAEARLQAAEALVDRCFIQRLEALAGPIPDVALTDDLMNAAVMSAEIDRNRRLLRRVLRAHLGGETDWALAHPDNQAFLARLREGGADVEQWLAEHPRRYRLAGVGTVRLHLERDPIRILQMGNYFDTCLSLGGVNSFSAVANACELNKRVIYATDAKGRVVGRKLLAINEGGELVGFHTYTSLPDNAGNLALRRAFLRYCRLFAAACRLPMGEEGEVPRLFAEHWYNDGIAPWTVVEYDEDGAPLERRSPRKKALGVSLTEDEPRAALDFTPPPVM